MIATLIHRVKPVSIPIILASGSAVRHQMLQQALVPFTVKLPRIDEQAIKVSMAADNAPARDIADCLAEHKARKISEKYPDHLVIGSDQVLEFDGTLLSKAETPEILSDQLRALSGRSHTLWSAAVIYDGGRPVWRYVGKVHLTMNILSDAFITGYVARNWREICHCVGGYQLEAEGVRLFARVDGDYYTVLGMPLLEVLGYLRTRGVIET